MEVLHLSAIYSPSEGARGWSVINTQYETPAREHICYRKRAVTVPYCYRMLAHSHSATSLYNLSQFKPISDLFTSIVYIVPASNLRTGIVSPRVIRVILCHFHILAPKIC